MVDKVIHVPPDPPDLGIVPLTPNPCELRRKQDLPPSGGYPKIPWRRNPAKRVLNGYMILGGYFGITALAVVLYAINYQKIKKHDIELISHKMAIYPLLLAERDREYLKQLRRNRDEEVELMKDVNGWQVGKFYNEKIYRLKTDDGDLVEPIFHEYFVHCDPRVWHKRASHALKS